MTTTLKTLLNNDGTKKIEIFRRDNGTFGFQELVFLTQERAWTPFNQRANPICDSLERAESEARERVDWLIAAGKADA